MGIVIAGAGITQNTDGCGMLRWHSATLAGGSWEERCADVARLAPACSGIPLKHPTLLVKRWNAPPLLLTRSTPPMSPPSAQCSRQT